MSDNQNKQPAELSQPLVPDNEKNQEASFVILFLLLSHSIIANQRLIKFLGILSLLIVFEFINLFIHPYLDKWTNHSIPMMLSIMVCVATAHPIASQAGALDNT